MEKFRELFEDQDQELERMYEVLNKNFKEIANNIEHVKVTGRRLSKPVYSGNTLSTKFAVKVHNTWTGISHSYPDIFNSFKRIIRREFPDEKFYISIDYDNRKNDNYSFYIVITISKKKFKGTSDSQLFEI